MIRRTALHVLLASALALPLAACGSEDSGGGSGGSAAASGDTSTDLAEKPTYAGSDEAPPEELVTSDVVVGDGPVAEAGSDVEVKYVGALYDTGEEFDSSWSLGDDETFPVTLGAGQVIEGFDQGITGMAVGGRRVVTIPSDLGYGPAGQGPIPPDATLVFVIDLVSAS